MSACSDWMDEGQEPQCICPACGHYACSHMDGVTCLRCEPDAYLEKPPGLFK